MKKLIVLVEEEFHRKVKRKVAEDGKTITKYIEELIKRDIEGECENVRKNG